MKGCEAILQRPNTSVSHASTPQSRPRLHDQPMPSAAPHPPLARRSPVRAPGPAARAAGRPRLPLLLAALPPSKTLARRHAGGAAEGLTLFLASRSAPRSSSSAMPFTLPVRAAQKRAVSPPCSAQHAHQQRQQAQTSASAPQSAEALARPAHAPGHAASRCALPAPPPIQQADHARHCSWPHRHLERHRRGDMPVAQPMG